MNCATIWEHRRGQVDLTEHGLIMGVLNVTPNSFSDGGHFLDHSAAISHARWLVDEGADIIDIGGESTRPGALPVPPDEELRRVIPVIRAIREGSDVLISIDTSKAEVAREAMLAGADIINDVTGLRGDPAMPTVAAETRAGAVLMHMKGTPATMQSAPDYADVCTEVRDFLRQSMDLALGSGMSVESLAVDPGIGFGKSPVHNNSLLAELPVFATLERPLLIGVSRKSYLGWLGDAPTIEERHWPGVAVTSFCRELGARIFRVHEPRPHREALRMTEAILHAAPAHV